MGETLEGLRQVLHASLVDWEYEKLTQMRERMEKQKTTTQMGQIENKQQGLPWWRSS